jgi:RNase H-fold protein (predicted Holliday junction resolvase)
MKETEYGISLKGLGILYKKPFGAILQKVNMFTQRIRNRIKVQFYFEDDYLRGEYIITNTLSIRCKENKKQIDKATAILLHRKLKLKR